MAGGDQKLESLLNLALDVTQEERQKSEELEVGYNRAEKTWQVIVRCNAPLAADAPEDWQIVQLSGGYAVVTLPQRDVELLASLPQVEYVEKPKRLYFEVDAGRAASCVSAAQAAPLNLTGRDILIAVIDSGVDYFHPDFRDADGGTRILALWDQTAVPQEGSQAGRVPEGFAAGVEYTKEEIDRALEAGSREAGYEIVPERDVNGHGTQVLGIAAGNGRSSGGRFRGVAPESGLIVVKLGMPREQGFPRTAELMQAVEYVVRTAEEIGRPVAINISIGNTNGSHRGTSLLETYIDMMAERGRNVIAVGTGNEGSTGGHASGYLREDGQERIEFLVNDYEPAMSIQLWKNYADNFRITIVHPDGRSVGPIGQETGPARYHIANNVMLVYYGEPSPYQSQQEIFLDFIPDGPYLDSGVWAIVLTPVRIVTGEYQMWMTDARSRNSGTRFLRPSPDATMTIPSMAFRVIAVGAYDARRNAYAPFSGRGWPQNLFRIRPDLTAPGVDITTTAAGGGYISVSGTSAATPFVTGAAALLMEWGIVNGNDPYLYGEKVRAYLIRGARELPGFAQYPNNQVGYGALCVRESLPV